MTQVQQIALGFYGSGIGLDEYCMLQEYAFPEVVKPGLLQEGVKDILLDVVQAALGAGAIVLTGGMGGDTAVDVVFAVDKANDVSNAVSAITSAGGVLGVVMQELLNIKSSMGLDGIYRAVQNIVGAVIESDAGQSAVDVLNKIRDSIQELMDSVIDAATEWIGTLVPDDAGLAGTAIREAVQAAFSFLSDRVYDILGKAMNALPAAAKEIVFTEGGLTAFLTGLIDTLVAHLNEKQDEWMVTKQAKATASAIPAMLIPGVGTMVAGAKLTADTAANIASEFPSVIKYLDEEVRSKIPEAASIFNRMIGLWLGGAALLQIIVKGDYAGASQGPVADAAGAVAGAVGLDSDKTNIPIPGAPQSAGTSAGAIAESKRQIQMTDRLLKEIISKQL